MKKDKALRQAVALVKALRPAAPGEFVPFVGTIPNDPQFKALTDWAKTLALADKIVVADAEAKTTKATAAAILRAGKIARGEIVELPKGAAARAIVAAGRKRRGEDV